LEAELVDGINDVAALTDVGAVDLLAQYNNIGICLMHMQGLPDSMQVNPSYDDVLQEVGNYLLSRSQVCVDHGIQKSRLVLDPGFGFGKNLQHHIILMQNLDTMIKQSDFPWLIGVSRKRMLGEITGEDQASERVGASVAAALASIARGAHIVRVHDVKETKQAVQVWQAMGVFNKK
jgi:dihydropteroate synthase